MSRVPKLDDVAKLAGVSTATVSRVINHYGPLSQKTINKVHQAMETLNYHPNALARALQGKSSKFIGLIFPNLTNPFFAELVQNLESKLFMKGYKVIIASAAENEQIEHDYLGMLMANQVDGIISGSHNLQVKEYQRISAPIVSFDRHLAKDIPVVSADNYQGGKLAAQFLFKNKAEKIAVLVDEDTSVSPTLDRLQAAIDFFTKNNVSFDPLDSNEIELEKVFPGPYDGVIASNDISALKIAAIFQKNGSVLNKDFFITGYDGSRVIREIAPQLPTVIQPIEKIAEVLVSTLLQQIDDPNKQAVSTILSVAFWPGLKDK